LSKVVWPAVVTSPPRVTGDIAFSNQHNCRPLRRKEKEKTETKLTQLLRPPACLPAAATAVEYATVFLSLDAQSSSTSRDICTAHMVHYSLSSSKRVGKKTPAKNGATGLAKKEEEEYATLRRITRAWKRQRHHKFCCHARETNGSSLLDQSRPLSLAIILLAGALPGGLHRRNHSAPTYSGPPDRQSRAPVRP